MQKLQFESAWDKTISKKDRERIKQAFHQTNSSDDQNIKLHVLWKALNHKEELLITVLVHNFSKQYFSFHQKTLLYFENKMLVAEHTFRDRTLNIERETSMPWTFIFPAESFQSNPKLENGEIKLKESVKEEG